MGFSSYDDLINEATSNGKVVDWFFFKQAVSVGTAGVWVSTWQSVGSPATGSTPVPNPGEAHTQATGSMYFSNVSPDTRHLTTLSAVGSAALTIMIYDRLVSVGQIQLSGSTGNRDVMSTTLPRYTDGVGVEAWLEVTTATATTAPVVRMSSYTNQDGTTGRSADSVTFPAAATSARHMVKLPLAAADRGIRSIQTLNVDTVGTAGIVNVVLLKPLAFIPIGVGLGNDRDLVLQLNSLPRVYDGASLGIAFLSTGTGTINLWGMIRAVHG